MSKIRSLAGVFSSTGQPMLGSEMSDEEALNYARKHFPYGYFCLVRHWIWLDLEVSDEQIKILSESQRHPVLIYADTVVYDSERRWDVGDFVRTSPMHRFEDGFQFSTLNTTYLLLGPGQRKRTSLENVARIF